MEFSKEKIEEAMSQYIADNDDFGDTNDTKLIKETFESYKSLLVENTIDSVHFSILKEHANALEGIPKEIFEDFILYLQLDELENNLL